MRYAVVIELTDQTVARRPCSPKINILAGQRLQTPYPLSHHHGIGKLRKKWVPETISPTGVAMLQGVKARVDPKNIFASNNIVDLPK